MLQYDTGTRLVHVGAKSVPLTGAEFRVLEVLMRSAGQVISRDANFEGAVKNCRVRLQGAAHFAVNGNRDLVAARASASPSPLKS